MKTLIVFLLVFCLRSDAADYFAGLEQETIQDESEFTTLFEGNYFSGVLDDSSYFGSPQAVLASESDDPELSSYLQREGLNPEQISDHHQVLNFLQSQEDSNDPASIFYYAKALLNFAQKQDLSDQVEGMVRLAQELLGKLSDSRYDDSDFQDKAETLLRTEFYQSSSEVLQEVEELLEDQKVEEAYRLLRFFLHKDKFRDKPALRKYEAVLRTMARQESDPEISASYLSEANFIAKGLYEEDQWEETIEEGSDVEVEPPSQEPPDQEAVNNSVREALSLEEQGKHMEALHALRQIVLDTRFQAVKPRYFLALQYFKMAQMSQFRDRATQYERMGQLHLFEARNRGNKDLDKYPQNREWAEKAQGLAKDEETIEPQPSTEEKVNQAIREALALEEDGKGGEAVERMRQAVRDSDSKSSKALYFLAKIRYFGSSGSLEQVKEELEQAIRLRNRHTELHSENQMWADHAKDLLDRVLASQRPPQNTPQPPPTEEPPEEPEIAALTKPVSGVVTSKYGMRIHPIHRTERMHTGIDIGAAEKTPVYAMHHGKVIHADRMGGYGNTLIIEYDNGYQSLFAHLKDYRGESGTTRKNQRVRQGEQVGRVNSTGSSTGHHLHLELKKNGTRINPAPELGLRNDRGERF